MFLFVIVPGILFYGNLFYFTESTIPDLIKIPDASVSTTWEKQSPYPRVHVTLGKQAENKVEVIVPYSINTTATNSSAIYHLTSSTFSLKLPEAKTNLIRGFAYYHREPLFNTQALLNQLGDTPLFIENSSQKQNLAYQSIDKKSFFLFLKKPLTFLI